MTFRPRYSLLSLLIFMGLVGVGAKWWHGPHIERRNLKEATYIGEFPVSGEETFLYYNQWDGDLDALCCAVKPLSKNYILPLSEDLIKDAQLPVKSYFRVHLREFYEHYQVADLPEQSFQITGIYFVNPEVSKLLNTIDPFYIVSPSPQKFYYATKQGQFFQNHCVLRFGELVTPIDLDQIENYELREFIRSEEKRAK
jgi:hypothetical protein